MLWSVVSSRLPANIRLGWSCLTVTNTLAYLNNLNCDKKSFIARVSGKFRLTRKYQTRVTMSDCDKSANLSIHFKVRSKKFYSSGQLISSRLPANIRLGWSCLTVTKALAYLYNLNCDQKSFIALVSGQSKLTRKYQTRVTLSDCDKHASLSIYFKVRSKKFYSSSQW